MTKLYEYHERGQNESTLLSFIIHYAGGSCSAFAFADRLRARCLLHEVTSAGRMECVELVERSTLMQVGMAYALLDRFDQRRAPAPRDAIVTTALKTNMEAAEEISRRSRGTPRIANRILRRVRDVAEVRHQGAITTEISREALELLEVDQRGLERTDRALTRLGIAHTPEGRGTFVDLTVEENLRLGAYARREKSSLGQDYDKVYAYFPRLKTRRGRSSVRSARRPTVR